MVMAMAVMVVLGTGEIVRVIVAMFIVVMATMQMGMRFDGDNRLFSLPEGTNCFQKSTSLDPHQPRPEKRDEAITNDLNHAQRVAHELRDCPEHNGGNAHDGHGRKRLHDG
jgi:hypothetical protein